MAYAPLGEGYAGGTPLDVEFTAGGYSFTVIDPENQTGGLEDFMFRRYNATQGRWISPDPAGLAAVDPTNPQSWNRYAYVANNPLSFVDPSGLVYLYAEPPGGDAARNAFLYNHFLGDAGDGRGGGFGFSLNGFFNGMCNDFMPCGAAPTSLGQVFQSVWSDALGLPTNLNCPVVGGLSSYICGGVSPIMDVSPARQQCENTARQKYGNALVSMHDSRNSKAIQGIVKAEVLAGGLGCVLGGALGSEFGPPGTALGCGGGGIALAVDALPWAVVGNYVWQGFAAWGDIYSAERQFNADLNNCANMP